ncbi:MAG: hypothetical protein SFZ24_09415, partial [Planctomycetota bacterium]|nr:hypothetical protein [Planctomycetota bacterium]
DVIGPALAAALCVIASSAVGAPPEAPPGPLPAVSGAASLSGFFRAAAVGRVDVVCLGDSNQLYLTDGWDHGWARALEQRFGLYATGLLSPGENGGNGSGSGYRYQVAGTLSNGQFRYDNAPQPLDLLMDPASGMAPLAYMYVPSGFLAGAMVNQGVVLERVSSLDVNAELDFHVTYAQFPGSSGFFQPVLREAEPPYGTLLVWPPISTAGAAFAAVTQTFTAPAMTRERNINFRFSPWENAVTGPFLSYYVRIENPARATGAALHTLYAAGGMSAYDMGLALRRADDAYLSLYFDRVRALQGPTKAVLVRINTGLNDRVEGQPSLRSGITPGSSPEAYADNLLAIMDRIRDIWSLNGWPQEELYFLLSVSHPVATPDEVALQNYRRLAAGLTAWNPRTASTNFDALTAWWELWSSSWYADQGYDVNHLLRPGVEALAARELLAMEDGAAYHDVNADGALDIEDLYTWHRQRPDLTGDGSADVTDARALQRAVRSVERADVIPAP